MSELNINGDRLNNRLAELSRIGRHPDGGMNRLAFTKADRDGRDYVESCMRRLGMEISIDPAGNLFGVLPGILDGGAVMAGSHTDTVASGGRFDGALGVLAALEVAEVMIENEIQPERSYIVSSFVNEEGVRYMPDMMGSLYHRGAITIEELRNARGIDGSRLGDELDLNEMHGQGDIASSRPTAFVELHIEQGPVLVDSNLLIGAVSGVQGLSWTTVTVQGSANHAGTTPMDRRQDAGRVAARLVSAIYEDLSNITGQRITIGSMKFEPGLINVIPGRTTFTVDLRNPDESELCKAESSLTRILEDTCETGSCPIGYDRIARVAPVEFSPRIVDLIRESALRRGLPMDTLVSGAGHDAQILATVYETAMIFIPSAGGVSHSKEEYSTPEAIEAGANVLLDTVRSLTTTG